MLGRPLLQEEAPLHPVLHTADLLRRLLQKGPAVRAPRRMPELLRRLLQEELPRAVVVGHSSVHVPREDQGRGYEFSKLAVSELQLLNESDRPISKTRSPDPHANTTAGVTRIGIAFWSSRPRRRNDSRETTFSVLDHPQQITPLLRSRWLP